MPVNNDRLHLHITSQPVNNDRLCPFVPDERIGQAVINVNNGTLYYTEEDIATAVQICNEWIANYKKASVADLYAVWDACVEL